MKTAGWFQAAIVLGGLIASQGCSNKSKFPDITDSLHTALKQAGYKDVAVNQDRDKGVITLKGNVATDNDKAQAESIARSMAAGEVVGNEIAVLPSGGEGVAKTVNADLDDGIKKNVDAALLQNGLHDHVKYDVVQGVVTLTGEAKSEAQRAEAQQVVAAVPNVQQVVNKIDVKDQRATSSR